MLENSNPIRKSIRRRAWVVASTLTLSNLVGACADLDSGPHGAASESASDLLLQPRVPANKLALSNQLAEGATAGRLVVKFDEGTGVRLDDNGQLVAKPELAGQQFASGDSVAKLKAELATAQSAVAGNKLTLRRLFALSDSELAKLKARGEKNSGRELADLGLYVSIEAEDFQSDAAMEDLRTRLNALDSVEVAYIEPLAEDAQVSDPDALTPAFDSLQGYRDPAPLGIDADFANSLPGGRGEGLLVVDVEQAWQATHEDLPAPIFSSIQETSDDNDHGTAVAGVLGARDNGFGTTGLVPDADLGYASHLGRSPAAAIMDATRALSAGDALLIEVHRRGPETATCPSDCNPAQCNYIALEHWQADFDAIAAATALGIVVVEAAGNGTVNLDDPAYRGHFDRSVRDSGAIIVGASRSDSRSPMCWTNHGARVDVHGWGQNVVTLGYGNLYRGSDAADRDDWYTASFSGTSSASPIVTGAVLALQGIAIEDTGEPLTPWQMRDLLRDTGTPQESELDRPIGGLPDLRAATERLLSENQEDECVDHAATVENHELAGRVACTRQRRWFRDVITECHALGSGTDVGTNLAATVTLSETQSGHFAVGACDASCESTPEVCGDDTDNDCDGQVDEDCAPQCIPSGDACTSDADCCSGTCNARVFFGNRCG